MIKQASGHKTDIAFSRYNLVTEDEMMGMKWYDSADSESGAMDTYYGHHSKIKDYITYSK